MGESKKSKSKTDVAPDAPDDKQTELNILWDDSEMQTVFANAVNASCTIEEFMLFFGANETWKPEPGAQVRIKLNHRMVLSPHTAKRLSILLNAVLGEYERRFGDLNVDGRVQVPNAGPAEG